VPGVPVEPEGIIEQKQSQGQQRRWKKQSGQLILFHIGPDIS
jgi:hypothetical protein